MKKEMVRIPPEVKEEILQAIREHTAKHGQREYMAIRSRWPEYLDGPPRSAEERRFYRLVREAREAGPAPAEAKADAIRRARGATKKHLPAVPSPSAFIAKGADADRAVDIMGMLHVTLRDVMLMRDQAVKVDEEGNEKIRNLVQMDTSIKRRLDLVNTFLSVFQEVYDLHRMRQFYDEIIAIIVEEIHPLEPEVSARIMERLKALNDREVMTIHATPS